MDNASPENRYYGCHGVELYNRLRTHQALDYKTPDDIYYPRPTLAIAA